MEQKGGDASRQTPLQFRCKKILPDAGKSNDSPASAICSTETVDKQDVGTSLALPTPERKIQPPRNRSKENIFLAKERKSNADSVIDAADGTNLAAGNPKNSISEDVSIMISEPSINAVSMLEVKDFEIPDKYRTIVEFFDRMECSVRLLHLRKKQSTFQNICTQVEVMTKRKFLYSHLAQMKYIFSEAIHIEKILVHDDKSSCMLPELKITLLSDILKHHHFPNKSASMALRQSFRARLLDFNNAHPEVLSIPEATLPGPFNPKDRAVLPIQLHDEASVELLQPDISFSASHFSSSLNKEFSRKCPVPETQKTQLLALPVSSRSAIIDDGKSNEVEVPPKKDDLSSVTGDSKTPTKIIADPDCRMAYHFCESTPMKTESTPSKLMVGTPALQTPKISKVGSPDEKSENEAEAPLNSARRSLLFSPSKPVGSVSESVVRLAECESSSFHSSRTVTRECIAMDEYATGYLVTNMVVDGGDMAVSVENQKKNQMVSKRENMLASLIDLFNTVRLIFQSINRFSITKQELVHKILSYNYDIEETDELEEQLQLLEKLVPDWICGKTVSSGDFLYCIQKKYDPEAIRARIVEAV